MRRHGREYDMVLDQYMEDTDKPAPYGLICKSKKTGIYRWFDRKRVAVPEYEKLNVSTFNEDITQYTSSYELFDEYLDHLIRTASKKGKEQYVIIKHFHNQKKLAVPSI
tara:strand:+ start:109 stop:435 length:327 start_codon:yes stop_codon:yes gene_type:complete